MWYRCHKKEKIRFQFSDPQNAFFFGPQRPIRPFFEHNCGVMIDLWPFFIALVPPIIAHFANFVCVKIALEIKAFLLFQKSIIIDVFLHSKSLIPVFFFFNVNFEGHRVHYIITLNEFAKIFKLWKLEYQCQSI